MKTIHVAALSIVFASSLSLQADEVPAEIRALLDCSGKSIQQAQVEAENLKMLARGAISSDPATAKRSIEKLRERGPQGLQALLDKHAELLKPQPQLAIA